MTGIESAEALHKYRVMSKVVVTPAVLYLDKRNIIFLEGVDKRQADIVQEPPKHPTHSAQRYTSRDQTSMPLQESQVSALMDHRDESGRNSEIRTRSQRLVASR